MKVLRLVGNCNKALLDLPPSNQDLKIMWEGLLPKLALGRSDDEGTADE
jgi:hypothetical protein